MKKNNKPATLSSKSGAQLPPQAAAFQIKTDPARIEELIQSARVSCKTVNSFLAEELHYGAITSQELIDTLRYFSLMAQEQSEIPQ